MNQEKHHEQKSVREEYFVLLEKFEIDFKEDMFLNFMIEHLRSIVSLRCCLCKLNIRFQPYFASDAALK